MVNIQMVPVKKGNVSVTYRYLKKSRFGNGRAFDSVTEDIYLLGDRI